MQRRRRERARSSWPTTENNNGSTGLELLGAGDDGDEADGAEQPGDADNGEDGHERYGEGEQSLIEEMRTARHASATAAEKSIKEGGAGSALLFEDDENKSAILESEVVRAKFRLAELRIFGKQKDGNFFPNMITYSVNALHKKCFRTKFVLCSDGGRHNGSFQFRWPNRMEEQKHFMCGFVAATLETASGAATGDCLGA